MSLHPHQVIIEETCGTPESRRLSGHTVLHPPARNEDCIRKILAYLAIVVYEHLITGVIIHESVAAVTRYPGAVRNKSHVNLVILVPDRILQLLDAVYSELDAGRPVIAASENHIFVCDGYEQDYLHINWGWNGYCNGYFKTVTTSSASRGQLPFQYILIGITPLFDSLQATIRVDQPGSLSRMIDRAVLDRITSLTVYGTLNGSDIKCLRRMAGASDPLGEQEDIGSLMNLDLSGVRIITGMPYATYHADGYIISGRATDRDSGEYRYRYNLSEVTDSIWKEIVDHRLDNRGDMLLRRDSKGQIYISYYALDNVIGKRMFSDCQSLKNIILPDVTQSVDEDAFSGCRSLETVRNLPQTRASRHQIASLA